MFFFLKVNQFIQFNCGKYSSQFPRAPSDILRLLTLSFVFLQDSSFITVNNEEKQQTLIVKKLEPEFILFYLFFCKTTETMNQLSNQLAINYLSIS